MPLERLFGPGAARFLEPLKVRCQEMGLPFDPPARLSNTRLACEAAEFARDAGKFPEFHRAALAAYFAHGEDVGDVEVLVRIAGELGLDGAGLRQALAAGTYAGRRKAAEQEARSLGVTGVPAYFFAGGPKVVGAQPLEQFRMLVAAMVADVGAAEG